MAESRFRFRQLDQELSADRSVCRAEQSLKDLIALKHFESSANIARLDERRTSGILFTNIRKRTGPRIEP